MPKRTRRQDLFRLIAIPALLTCQVVLAALAAHAQPKGDLPKGRPFQVVEERLTTLESEFVALRGLVDTIEQTLTPLEGLERCVRVFEGELGGLPGPHILFTRCNVHVRSGELATDAPVNGLGNLVVGYNEGRCFTLDEPGGTPSPDPRFPAPCLNDGECGGGSCLFGDRQGSHNLIVGQQHEYTSHAGIVAGRANALRASDAAVTAGYYNEVRAAFASVHGGFSNIASGEASTVASGRGNVASGESAAVLGGDRNLASGESAAVVAGRYNEAIGVCSVVVAGGDETLAGTPVGNRARGDFSAILGGQLNVTGQLSPNDGPGTAATVAGGFNVNASGPAASVSGGQANVARGFASVVGGGAARAATSTNDWRAGDLFQDE